MWVGECVCVCDVSSIEMIINVVGTRAKSRCLVNIDRVKSIYHILL